MALVYKSRPSGYRFVVTDTRPRRLSSSMRVCFSDVVLGDALRTSLCGENGDADDRFIIYGVRWLLVVVQMWSLKRRELKIQKVIIIVDYCMNIHIIEYLLLYFSRQQQPRTNNKKETKPVALVYLEVDGRNNLKQ